MSESNCWIDDIAATEVLILFWVAVSTWPAAFQIKFFPWCYATIDGWQSTWWLPAQPTITTTTRWQPGYRVGSNNINCTTASADTSQTRLNHHHQQQWQHLPNSQRNRTSHTRLNHHQQQQWPHLRNSQRNRTSHSRLNHHQQQQWQHLRNSQRNRTSHSRLHHHQQQQWQQLHHSQRNHASYNSEDWSAETADWSLKRRCPAQPGCHSLQARFPKTCCHRSF